MYHYLQLCVIYHIYIIMEPLEFTECLVDSPFFREKLHFHEKELEKTSQQIKQLIKEVKDLLNAAKSKWKYKTIVPQQ